MYKVLVVDDEDLFRKNLVSKIDWASLNLNIVGEAENGQEALKLIKITKPDIVLCDIKMPLMDGVEVLKNIKKSATLKFIVLSGYNDFEFTKDAIKYGAFDYILKPIKFEEFIGVLIRAIDSLDAEVSKQNISLISRIELNQKMVEQYESLLIHYTESRDIENIIKCIDDFYSTLDDNPKSEIYFNSFMEFLVLSNKICKMFKLDSNLITNKFNLDITRYSSNEQKQLIPEKTKQIFSEIINQLICTKKSEGKKIISEVLELIDNHYNEKISLNNISKMYFINPSYFSQLFKSVVNENFSTYLITKRIEKAKELLDTTTLKIYQVAEMVGYDDDKYFSHIFRKYTKQSPSEYRLKYKPNT